MVLQGDPRSLQHWDSPLEESGYSPRISCRVTPPAAFGDSPAKARTDPFMTLPLSSDAAASDAYMLGEMPSDPLASGCQILEAPIIPDFGVKGAKGRPSPSGIPPSDSLASDAHAAGQSVIMLPPIPESQEEGQAAEPPGSVHLLGGEAVLNSPSEVTCDDEHDPLTHVPKLAAASGAAAIPEIQSVKPAAQRPSDSGSQQAADTASGISAAAMHPHRSSSSLLEVAPETAKVEVPEVPLLPRCPTLDGSTIMAVSSAPDSPSSSTLTPSMTPVESGMASLDAAACTASDSLVSQTDNGSSLAGDLVSAGGDSAESGSANADSEAAAGVSDMQSAGAQGSVESVGAGPAAGSPTRAARQGTHRATFPAKGTPINAASSQPAQGIPTPPVAGSLPEEGVPSADAASSPAAQGIPSGALPGTGMPSPCANSPPEQVIPMSETSAAVPAGGILSRIAARDQVVYPVFGVARDQNGRAYMEDRADVLPLQLPYGEEAHMLAVGPSHISLPHYLCVQRYLCDTQPLL